MAPCVLFGRPWRSRRGHLASTPSRSYQPSRELSQSGQSGPRLNQQIYQNALSNRRSAVGAQLRVIARLTAAALARSSQRSVPKPPPCAASSNARASDRHSAAQSRRVVRRDFQRVERALPDSQGQRGLGNRTDGGADSLRLDAASIRKIKMLLEAKKQVLDQLRPT